MQLRLGSGHRRCRNNRPPLGKTRAHLKVFLESVAQAVQTFGDFFTWKTSELFCSSINFDAGNDAGIGQDFDQRRAVLLLLTDGLVVKNRTTDTLAETRRTGVYSGEESSGGI